MSNIESLRESIKRAYNQGKKIGFALDLDGATVHRPPVIHIGVAPETDLDKDLVRLIDNGQKVFINTGRPESYVEGLLPTLMSQVGKNPHVWVSTENGACVRGYNDFLETKSLKNVGFLRSTFADVSQRYPGTVIEVGKNYSMTISVAKAEEKVAAFHDISEEAKKISKDLGFEVISGLTDTDGYIEFVNPAANKGSSTVLVLNEVDPDGKIVWYAHGDSKADEAMLEVVKSRGGNAVGVGTRAPQNAEFFLDSHVQTQQIIALAAHTFG